MNEFGGSPCAKHSKTPHANSFDEGKRCGFWQKVYMLVNFGRWTCYPEL